MDGKWSENLIGINVRKYLFILLCFALLFYSILNKFKIHALYISLGILIIFIFWAIIIPIIYGIDFKYSFSEASPLLGFMLIPYFVNLFKKNVSYWIFTRNFILVLAVLNCLIHIVIVFGFYNSLFDLLSSKFLNIVDPERLGAISLTFSVDETRVVWTGSIFFLIVFSRAFFIEKKNYFLQFILLSLSIATLLITSSRGFYFSIVISILLVFLLRYSNLLNTKKSFYFGTVLLVTLSIIVNSTPMAKYFLELIGWTRSISDDTRLLQASALFGEILNHPLFGKGFGATTLNFPRPIDEPYSFELYLLSLVMKIGVMGCILSWFLYFIFRNYFSNITSNIVNINIKSIQSQYVFLFSSIIFISGGNPYLLNSAGFIFTLYIAIEYAIFNENNAVNCFI